MCRGRQENIHLHHHHRHLFNFSLFHHTPHTQSHTRAANFYIHRRIFLFLFFIYPTTKKKKIKLKEKRINKIFGKFTGWFMSRHLSSTLCCLWLKLENLFNLARNFLKKDEFFFAHRNPFFMGGSCSLSFSSFFIIFYVWNETIK